MNGCNCNNDYVTRKGTILDYAIGEGEGIGVGW